VGDGRRHRRYVRGRVRQMSLAPPWAGRALAASVERRTITAIGRRNYTISRYDDVAARARARRLRVLHDLSIMFRICAERRCVAGVRASERAADRLDVEMGLKTSNPARQRRTSAARNPAGIRLDRNVSCLLSDRRLTDRPAGRPTLEHPRR